MCKYFQSFRKNNKHLVLNAQQHYQPSNRQLLFWKREKKLNYPVETATRFLDLAKDVTGLVFPTKDAWHPRVGRKFLADAPVNEMRGEGGWWRRGDRQVQKDFGCHINSIDMRLAFEHVNVCIYSQGWILGEAKEAIASGPLVFQRFRGSPSDSFALNFCSDLRKACEPL